MAAAQTTKVEFGDFQTPQSLADSICAWLVDRGVAPATIIEPTCGVGSFVIAAMKFFPEVEQILGFEYNEDHVLQAKARVSTQGRPAGVSIEQADFFARDWTSDISDASSPVLVLGNFPWVTNATQGVIGGSNLPDKSNFQKQSGLDAITGKANFDISEWMLLQSLDWLETRPGHIAMLAKSAVARKILHHAEKRGMTVNESALVGIDAKREFGASVDACLLYMAVNLPGHIANNDYSVFEDLADGPSYTVGHRDGLVIRDLARYEANKQVKGDPPQKWRSGVKHDASQVMEMVLQDGQLVNGMGHIVDVEDTYVYPMLKGSDIGKETPRAPRFMLVTQESVGQATDEIAVRAPKTWAYLEENAGKLDGRRSVIYKKNPRFSVFGVGDYTFKPWKIAICGLTKGLKFRLVGPVGGKPVVFGDTVYFLSFDTQDQAQQALSLIESESVLAFLDSMTFWDEKRPIKTAILNTCDWERAL